MTGGKPLESISVLSGAGDLLVYDLNAAVPHSFFTGAQVLRHAQGRQRWFAAAGLREVELVCNGALAQFTAVKD